MKIEYSRLSDGVPGRTEEERELELARRLAEPVAELARFFQERQRERQSSSHEGAKRE